MEKTLQRVIVASILMHLLSITIGTALFGLFLDNNCTADDIMEARPNYLPIQETGYEFGWFVCCSISVQFLHPTMRLSKLFISRISIVSAAIQFRSVWSIVDAGLILTSSPIVFTITFVLRHLTLQTLHDKEVVIE